MEKMLTTIATDLGYSDICQYKDACQNNPWEVVERLTTLVEKRKGERNC